MAKKVFEILFQNRKLRQLESSTENLAKKSKEVHKSFGALNTQLSKLKVTPFENLELKASAFGATISNFLGNTDFSKPFDAFSTGFMRGKQQGMGFFAANKRGLMAFAGQAQAAFGGLIPMAGSLAVALGSALAPIAAITAAIFFLKKAWDNNFGGIQTQFSKLMGRLKDLWGQFNLAVNQFFQDFSPIAKPFVDILFFLANRVISNLIIQFKILRAVFRVAFLPLRIMVKQITKGIEQSKKLIKTLSQLKFVQMTVSNIKKQFDAVKTVIEAIGTRLKPLFDMMKQIAEFLGLIENKSAGASTNASRGSNSLNGFQAIPPSTTVGIPRSSVNNNTVNVYSAGPVSAQNAPRIGSTFSQALMQGMRGA